jgi:hypothetical protein
MERPTGAPDPVITQYKTLAIPNGSENVAAEKLGRAMDALFILESKRWSLLKKKKASAQLTEAQLPLTGFPTNQERI